MAKICAKCGKEWPDQIPLNGVNYPVTVCFECGSQVIDKPSEENGASFSVNLDGSAVNGGIHKIDSHNVSHNVDSHEIHTTTNNTTQNVTNYVQQAAKSAEETQAERDAEFKQFCEGVIPEGGIISPRVRNLLDDKMISLGLNRERCNEIIEVVVKKR